MINQIMDFRMEIITSQNSFVKFKLLNFNL